MKKVALFGVLIALMSGCSINITTEENQRKKTEEEMYKIMNTLYISDKNIQENGVEHVQIVSCNYDIITNCNSDSYRFIYPKKEMNLGTITNSLNKMKDSNKVENKSEMYSLSERAIFVSPQENDNEKLNFVFKINEENKLYERSEKIESQYKIQIKKNVKDVVFFKDRAILIKWL